MPKNFTNSPCQCFVLSGNCFCGGYRVFYFQQIKKINHYELKQIER